MGWNTWCTLSNCHNGDNNYFDRCNEWEVKDVASSILSNGMHELGYEYLNLDDCWAADTRDAQGNIQPDPDRFPSGLKALTDWLHARNLKFGLYTSAGDKTCNPGGRPKPIPGSFGHYEQDAATFASWGVDYVKIDWCGGQLTNPQQQHTQFSKALNSTGRHIHLELCRGYPTPNIPPYVVEVANSWRITGDHQDQWDNTMHVIEGFASPSNQGGPYNWNYGDFLMTGGPGCNANGSAHCPNQSDDEYTSEFSIWAVSASPLIVATDVRNLTAIMKRLLLNSEAISINQDNLAAPGKRVGFDASCRNATSCHIFARSLTDNTHAVVLLNADSVAQPITFPFSLIGWAPGARVDVRNVLDKQDLGTFVDRYRSPAIPAHGSVFLRISPAN
eukprot:TRINITY_DN3037_c0_g1_i1.p1 TRINITY_DN3037_c0_g1~~TRINITY_DN3037_c0_g1_i1.p1  ORF type:complete len:421 (-),score=56.93 TRINITY_DN3037_c0_g1_i1:47-1213(-)